MSAVESRVDVGGVSSRHLRYVAAGLAFAVATIHLFHPRLGVVGFAVYLEAGTPFVDPRPAAFVLSSVAILVGVNLAALGARRPPLYLLGMALMAIHVVAYFGWHMTGHGGALPWLEGHYHGEDPFTIAVEHLANDAWALTAKSAETLLFVVLAVLYGRERRREE